VNEWHLTAAVLLLGLVPCTAVLIRGEFRDGMVAVGLAGTLAALAFLALAEAERREPFGDLAIVMAVVSLAGSLISSRYLERSGPRAEDDRNS
jgi:multicomponent Na+:H+ antiporter subunit F